MAGPAGVGIDQLEIDRLERALARRLGLDIAKPRNLAKTVTVE